MSHKLFRCREQPPQNWTNLTPSRIVGLAAYVLAWMPGVTMIPTPNRTQLELSSHGF